MAERTVSLVELKSLLGRDDVVVLDVRRRAAYEADTAMLPNAAWRNPDEVATWSAALPKDKQIVVYCIHGHAVSNAVIDHLQQSGFAARYVEGGIEGWKESGGAVVEK